MVILLSPSKAMDFSSPVPGMERSSPLFLRESQPLVERLRPMTAADLRSLFGVSDKVAALNQDRFRAWTVDDHEVSARPALFAYAGPVYAGLAAGEFGREDRAFAQRHLRIISGLYGLLRPSDAILPYRLDMGTKLDNPRGDNLYDYWRDRVTARLSQELSEQGREHPLLINLASKEYSSVVDQERIPARVVECRFKDRKGEEYRQIQYYVKRARGLMAKFIVKNRIESIEGLRSFDLEGYRYSYEQSEAEQLVFLREHNE